VEDSRMGASIGTGGELAQILSICFRQPMGPHAATHNDAPHDHLPSSWGTRNRRSAWPPLRSGFGKLVRRVLASGAAASGLEQGGQIVASHRPQTQSVVRERMRFTGQSGDCLRYFADPSTRVGASHRGSAVARERLSHRKTGMTFDRGDGRVAQDVR
jgi:hypothetical protein